MFATTLMVGTSTAVSSENISTDIQQTGTEVQSEMLNQSEDITKSPKELEIKTLTTREKVEEYFKDSPVLIDIAFCESRYRQHNQNGDLLRGTVNSADVGVMQINERYHAETAVRLGYDLYSLEGNMAYARYLYEKQGTKPWVHSSHCWNNLNEVAFK